MGHLKFDIIKAVSMGTTSHAKTVMNNLGITYQHSTPQSMSDSWWFWNCENVPDTLPDYLTPLNLDPMECVGYGLSHESAIYIKSYGNKPIPAEYKDLKFYNWNGIYYYNHKPCAEVSKEEMNENEVIDTYNERFAAVTIYSSGYIFAETMGGDKYLKIN